jgi:hypothetical protein
VAIKLSKSKFVAGRQCLKRLYLQAHEPDAAAEAIIEQGREVGMLARQLFPRGVEVRNEGLDKAIRTTRELTANREVPAIFEGTFEHDGVLVLGTRALVLTGGLQIPERSARVDRNAER